MALQKKAEKQDLRRTQAVNIKNTGIKMTAPNTALALTRTSTVHQAAQTSTSIVQALAVLNTIPLQAVRASTVMVIPVQVKINTVQVHRPVNIGMVTQAQVRTSTALVAVARIKVRIKTGTSLINTAPHLRTNTNQALVQVANIPLPQTSIETGTKKRKSKNTAPAVVRKTVQAVRKRTWILIKKKSVAKGKREKDESARKGRGRRGRKERGKVKNRKSE